MPLWTDTLKQTEKLRAKLESNLTEAAKKTEDDFYDLSRAKQREFIDALARKLDSHRGKIRETPEFKRALDKLHDEWSEDAIEFFRELALDRYDDWMADQRDAEPPEDARNSEPYDVMRYEK